MSIFKKMYVNILLTLNNTTRLTENIIERIDNKLENLMQYLLDFNFYLFYIIRVKLIKIDYKYMFFGLTEEGKIRALLSNEIRDIVVLQMPDSLSFNFNWNYEQKLKAISLFPNNIFEVNYPSKEMIQLYLLNTPKDVGYLDLVEKHNSLRESDAFSISVTNVVK